MKSSSFLKVSSLLIILGFIFGFNLSFIFAQSEEAAEKREGRIEGRAGEAIVRPETAESFVKMIKERALAKLKKKKQEQLLKTKISYSQIFGYETNINADAETKGDWFAEEELYLDWLPTLNDYLGIDIYYWLVKQDYLELSDSSNFDNCLGGKLKIYPFESGKLKLEPGVDREILRYYRAKESSYDKTRAYCDFTYYLSKLWSFGGEYEYSFKEYDIKYARTYTKLPMDGCFRQTAKHQIDIYIRRYFGKLGIKLEGRVYDENDNDHYEEYYDREAWRAKLTFSRFFLKDDRLYASLSPYFERKNYKQRPVQGTDRYDDKFSCALSAYYILSKHCTLNPKVTYVLQKSNYDLGRYKDIIAQVGLIYDF